MCRCCCLLSDCRAYCDATEIGDGTLFPFIPINKQQLRSLSLSLLLLCIATDSWMGNPLIIVIAIDLYHCPVAPQT